jgi:hypothetical protein
MSRRPRNDAEAPGQDSFLDVVANLVGVLIILVMVVGTQAKGAIDAVAASAQANTAESPPALPDVAAAAKAVATVEHDILNLQQKSQREDFEVAFRRQERDQLQLLVSAATDQIEHAKNKLSQKDRANFEVSTKIKEAFKELSDLEDALAGLSENEKPVEVVKHYPTPMAKTVFGKELHFRLEGGRLTYVPFDEFVARLKADAPKQAYKLKETDRITESIGPLSGFRMRYTLKREVVSVPVSGGTAKGERVSLEQFILLPVSETLGEPVATALGEESQFRSLLREYNPKLYTVTLWVYPDSFQHFRPVRDALLKQGYVTAGRPMPEGHPIGGSPEGSRSAAQ